MSFSTDNFDFVDFKEDVSQLDYWLDERGYMSREDYKKGTVREYGFTEERIIQDFPIRGKAVYLHVSRRRWRDTQDGSIFTCDYDLVEEGSRLTPGFVAFLKGGIVSTLESIRSIGSHYGVNGSNLSRQYKEIFSDYRTWKQLGHAEEYILYPQNIGSNLAIDETTLSCGELYTFVTNRDAHGGKGALVAAIRGAKTETVTGVLELIPLARRKTVKEMTLDLSSSMMLIARRSFPKATVTNDRFHVHELYYDAIDELRISLRWMRDIENGEIARYRKEGIPYAPFRYANGDTRKQLLARAKYILTKHASKWTKSQQWRADIIFEFYPELKKAYELAMELTDIFNQKVEKDVARLDLARWYDKVDSMDRGRFRTVTETFRNHYDTILNYFINRSTNAGAESFNAKVKAFRSQFRGVTDIPFFLFRLSRLCA